MTTIDSCLFLALGTIMKTVPAIAPQYFPPSGIVGPNVSELWLEFMGWVNHLVGAAGIAHLQLRPAWPGVIEWAEASWEGMASLEYALSSVGPDGVSPFDAESGSIPVNRQSRCPNYGCV
jgi:hypothetical protein